jgi:hypothetical protein
MLSGSDAFSDMTTAHPSNKEQEICSCSLSAILAALVDAVDRLTLAVESRFISNSART